MNLYLLNLAFVLGMIWITFFGGTSSANNITTFTPEDEDADIELNIIIEYDQLSKSQKTDTAIFIICIIGLAVSNICGALGLAG